MEVIKMKFSKFVHPGIIAIAVFSFVASISFYSKANEVNLSQSNWRSQLTKQLPLLGHRNFIVIADSAYPMQSNPGIKTIYTSETLGEEMP
jgi:hypothetical protein